MSNVKNTSKLEEKILNILTGMGEVILENNSLLKCKVKFAEIKNDNVYLLTKKMFLSRSIAII